MWQAVLWDIGGVILDPDSVQRGRDLFVATLAVRFDLQPSEASEVWDRELGAYFRERDGNTFRPAHRGYQRALEAVVGEPVSVDEWLPLAAQAAHVAFQPVDGAVETIRTLAEEGCYLGVVSDIDAWEAEFLLTAFGIRELFDHVTTSAEVGLTKPAPEIFETALRRSPAETGRTLFVGDRYENDMRGGKRAGLVTVAFGDATEQASDDDPLVDLVIDDPRDLLDIVDLEGG